MDEHEVKPGIVSIAARLIEAMNRGDMKEYVRLKELSPLPKDQPIPLKTCDFHLDRPAPPKQEDR
jgi:hypothetical protein